MTLMSALRTKLPISQLVGMYENGPKPTFGFQLLPQRGML